MLFLSRNGSVKLAFRLLAKHFAQMKEYPVSPDFLRMESICQYA